MPRTVSCLEIQARVNTWARVRNATSFAERPLTIPFNWTDGISRNPKGLSRGNVSTKIRRRAGLADKPSTCLSEVTTVIPARKIQPFIEDGYFSASQNSG